ncbi:MAG: hypothetical protein IKZ36_05535, partial [Kiritimatiellae bacterium]|nr:hypothetical protein [Kiritimatiellia bacterium]
EEAQGFANAIINAKKTVKFCSVCQNLTDAEICGICEDKSRDSETICVVSDPKDVAAIEKTGQQIPDVIQTVHKAGVSAQDMVAAVVNAGGQIALAPMEFLGYTGKPAGYCIVFGYCAVAYLVGWCCMKGLVPRYRRVEL